MDVHGVRKLTIFNVVFSDAHLSDASEARRFYDFVSALVHHSREEDEYETPMTERPLCASSDGTFSVKILWNNHWWDPSAFMAILVACYRHGADLTSSQEVDDFLTAMQRYSAGERAEITLFFFFLAFSYDSRVRRACCKANSVLDSLGLSPPTSQPGLNMSRALTANVLSPYLNGKCSWEQTVAMLRQATFTGILGWGECSPSTPLISEIPGVPMEVRQFSVDKSSSSAMSKKE